MMFERPEYHLQLRVNGRLLSRVVIDQHYRERHSDLTDEIILDLVRQLDGGNFPIEDEEEDGFEYFRVEPVFYSNSPYRVILVLCVLDDYLGVVNAFRVKKKR